MARINLGDKVKDEVSGFTGIAIGRMIFLHGCDRVIVQPAVGKDGKMGDNATFDEPQLKVLKRAVVASEEHLPSETKTGGFNVRPSRNGDDFRP